MEGGERERDHDPNSTRNALITHSKATKKKKIKNQNIKSVKYAIKLRVLNASCDVLER